uniref:Uncharacterized protein n=1 Tax=Anguilla anguilla TaxID=7936 RepID=A0A0E9SK12_ANGAN
MEPAVADFIIQETAVGNFCRVCKSHKCFS